MNKIFFCLLGMLCCFNLQAQDNTIKNKISAQFEQYILDNPQEKLYIHTDKENYFAGENIWFKGYLVDATDFSSGETSNFIYVELIMSDSTLVSRQKIVKDSKGAFYGSFNIKNSLRPGEYILQAYSRLMLNNEDYLFRKQILIGNPMDKVVYSEIQYEKGKNGTIAKIRLVDYEGNPYIGERVYYSFRKKSGSDREKSITCDNQGKIEIEIPANNDMFSIRMDKKVLGYSQSFFIPSHETKLDFQMMPEGGYIVDNNANCIAFKALEENGLSVDVECELYDSKNVLLQKFSSQYRGMGVFHLNPASEKGHYVMARRVGDQQFQKFSLDNLRSNVGIKITETPELITASIIKSDPSIDVSQYTIAVYEHDQLLAAENKESITINRKDLKSGVMIFSLFDPQGKKISERLSFINQTPSYKLAVSANKQEYAAREKVKISISLLEEFGKVDKSKGNFSISVTDDHADIRRGYNPTIFNYLMLTSEIKGYIENPNDYFEDNDQITSQKKLELLMLTQAWRRYDIEKITAGIFERKPLFEREFTQEISGRVTNTKGKGLANSTVNVMCSALGIADVLTTEKDGTFKMGGLYFRDSVPFFFSAKNEKGKNNVDLEINEPVFAKIGMNSIDMINRYIKSRYINEGKVDEFADEQSNGIESQYYDPEGVKNFVLKAITVRGRKISTENHRFVDDVPKIDRVIDQSFISKFPKDAYLTDIFRRMPMGSFDFNGLVGMVGVQGALLFFNSDDKAIYVNDKWLPYPEDLMGVRADVVEDIQIMYTMYPRFDRGRGMRSLNDYMQDQGVPANMQKDLMGKIGKRPLVIAIYTKPGRSIYEKTVFSNKTLAPLGYAVPKQFYVPSYDLKKELENGIKDNRTTIYWNPNLEIEEGNTTNVEFYTSDQVTSYTVVIEGITKDGEPIRKTTKIKRK